MAKITNVTNAWQSVTLSANEIWQVHEGAVLLDTDASEPDRLGLLVERGEGVLISSGLTVYYKLANRTSALIARVAV